VRDAALRVEEDLRRVVVYINDQVVPEIRLNGSHALRAAAAELQKLAQRMDDRSAAAHGQGPPAPPAPDRIRTATALKRIAHLRRTAAAPGRALGRTLGWALLPALALALAGCRHRTRRSLSSPPPLTSTARGATAARPTHPNAASRPAPSVSEGTAASAAQPALPHGKPVSTEVGLASWYGLPTPIARAPTAPSTTKTQ